MAEEFATRREPAFVGTVGSYNQPLGRIIAPQAIRAAHFLAKYKPLSAEAKRLNRALSWMVTQRLEQRLQEDAAEMGSRSPVAKILGTNIKKGKDGAQLYLTFEVYSEETTRRLEDILLGITGTLPKTDAEAKMVLFSKKVTCVVDLTSEELRMHASRVLGSLPESDEKKTLCDNLDNRELSLQR